MELLVEDGGLSAKFHIDVDTSTGSQGFVDGVELVGIHSQGEFGFVVFYLFLDGFGSANGTFFFNTIIIFINPRRYRTNFTEKLCATFAIVPNILKVELGFAAFTFFGFGGCCDEFFGLWLCGEL